MNDQHFDVAAYALGVLDARDADRFEAHLADCEMCMVELESLLPVVDVLADIDADSLVATEQSRRDGLVLNRMISAVGQERRRAQSRRLYSLAAAVVAFAVLAVGALFAGSRWFSPTQGTNAQRPFNSTTLDPLPDTNGPGVGGDELPTDRVGGSDPRSGVRLDAGFEKKDFGTQVSFLVSNIKGPQICRLVAVRTDGQQEVLSTWTVGEKGWGSGAGNLPPALTAVTALPRDQIAHVQVQSLDAAGTPTTLVRVP
jgi:Putative zinc-finger